MVGTITISRSPSSLRDRSEQRGVERAGGVRRGSPWQPRATPSMPCRRASRCIANRSDSASRSALAYDESVTMRHRPSTRTSGDASWSPEEKYSTSARSAERRGEPVDIEPAARLVPASGMPGVIANRSFELELLAAQVHRVLPGAARAR